MDIYAKTTSATGCAAAQPYGGAETKMPVVSMLETQISDNLALVQALAERAERLADRICGTEPSDAVGKAQAGLGGNGLLDTLRSFERVVQDRLYVIDYALRRMEADLG